VFSPGQFCQWVLVTNDTAVFQARAGGTFGKWKTFSSR
jgi:hypothetical protein